MKRLFRHHRLVCVLVLSSFACAATSAEQSLIGDKTPLEQPKNHGGFNAFAFSPDGKTVAGGTGAIKFSNNGRDSVGGGEVVLWNAQTGKLVKALGEHGDSVRWVAFSQDGKTLISASRGNGVIKVWQMPVGRLQQTLKINVEDKSTDLHWPRIALSDDGSTLVTISSRVIPLDEESRITTGGDLTVWNLKTGDKLWSKPESDAYVATLTPNGRGMVTVQYKIADPKTDDKGRNRFRGEYSLQSWNVKTEKVIGTADLSRIGSPSAIELLGGKSVALVTSGGLSILNRETGEATHEIKWNKERAFGDVFISDDGKTVGRAKPGFLEIVDVESGETQGLVTTEFPNHLWNATFSPDLTLAAGHISGAAGGPVVIELVQQ